MSTAETSFRFFLKSIKASLVFAPCVICGFLLTPLEANAQYSNKVIYGMGPNETFGQTLVGNTDFNKDGIRDFAAGTISPGGGVGLVRVYSSNGNLQTTLFGLAVGDNFGSSLAVGDLNGDTYPDLLVGAMGAGPCPGGLCSGTNTNGHYVRAISGQNWAPLYTVTGGIYSGFGETVAVIGDINGDAKPDFIVGIRYASRQSSCSCSSARGQAQVHSGANGAILYTFTGSNYGDAFGSLVGGVGDVNGDGVPDFAAASARNVTNAAQGYGGYIRVYSGSNGAQLYSVTHPSVQYTAGTIFSMPDTTGDGKPEFVVPAPGSVRLLSGANGANVWVLPSFVGASFAMSASFVGDLNKDNYPDIVVGNVGNAGTYEARTVSGNSGQTLYRFTGTPNDLFGTSVAGVGDINGDGRPDFGVGAPNDSRMFSGGGSVNLYFAPSGMCNFYRINGATVCM